MATMQRKSGLCSRTSSSSCITAQALVGDNSRTTGCLSLSAGQSSQATPGLSAVVGIGPNQEIHMRQVPLTRGLFALVDDEDYAEIGGYNWQAVPRRNGVYAKRCEWDGVKGRTVLMHRQIANCPKGKVVDHKDGNPLNNCRSNLRVCTNADNRRNSKAPLSPEKKQFRGVFRFRKGWRAVIKVDYKNLYGSVCKTPEDAARGYDVLAARHHGEFARLNFPA